MEELLRSDIDVVCICTPSGFHAANAVQAAEAGKHIVLEKSIGITAEQLGAIALACERNSIRLCTISQMFFSPDYQKLKKMVDEGRFGRVFLGDISMKFFPQI